LAKKRTAKAAVPADAGPVAIACGGGAFPLALAEAVRASGREVLLFPIRGFADPALERFPHHWLALGQAGRLLRLMHQARARELVFIGSLVRPRLWQIRFDLKSLALLPYIARIFRGGDNRMLSAIALYFGKQGIRVRGADEVAPGLLMPEGVIGKRRPDAADEEDIAFGFSLVRTLGPFDVGQAAAIARKRVLAIEAAEGTSGLLANVAAMRKNGRLRLPKRAGILVKAPKPNQDRRVDLPAIGVETIKDAAAAGLKGIAVEAGGCLVADADALVRAADAAGLFVVGIAPGSKR
jgi:UDP-2,3-diacylglucosamine hydrolase